MDTRVNFFKVFKCRTDLTPIAFLGTAFTIGPNGTLLTNRHVVDVPIAAGKEIVAILDELSGRMCPLDFGRISLTDPLTSNGLDIACCLHVVERGPKQFFPILPTEEVMLGLDVRSFGFHAIAGDVTQVTREVQVGHIVSIRPDSSRGYSGVLELSYPVIEGNSGSAVYTYHNGHKVAGVCFGTESHRVVAAENLQYKDEKIEVSETINRIIERGLAFNSREIVRFLDAIGGVGHVVSADRIDGFD